MSHDSPPATRCDVQRVKCPDCPDGQLWNSKGPTNEACPTCGGDAFVWRATASPYDVSGNPTKEYPGE